MFVFFFHDPSPSEFYTLSLHDALPTSVAPSGSSSATSTGAARSGCPRATPDAGRAYAASCSVIQSAIAGRDRKSTRLNSSHLGISYTVFCLKKKKTNKTTGQRQKNTPK